MKYIDEGIWIVEGGMSFAGTTVDLRSTVCRLDDGSVWVHSPIPLTDAIRQSLAEVGPVGHIVTGSNGHNLFLLEWHRAYPQAAVHVTRGIPKKLKDLRDFRILDGTEFPHDFESAQMGDVPFFDEHVFYHSSSKSLIVTDFIQNHPRELRTSWIQRLFFAPAGFRDICIAPPLKFKFMIKDHDAFAAFCRKLRSFDVSRIIVTHGPVIETEANGIIERLTERFL